MTPPDPTRLSKPTRVLLGLSALFWAAMLIWAGSILLETRQLAHADGTVVGLADDTFYLYQYRPVIRFPIPAGQSVTITGHNSQSNPPYETGETVRVYYDPRHPQSGAVIDNFWERWFSITVMAGVVAVFTVIALVFFLADGGVARFRKPAVTPLTRAERRRRSRRQLIWISLAPITAGIVLLGIATLSALHQRQVSARYVHGTGTVTGFQKYRSQSGAVANDLYAAVVSFQTRAGRTITFVQGSRSTDNSLDAGQTVPILYDESMPEKALIDSFRERWGVAVILGVVGLPFLAAGLLILMIGCAKVPDRLHQTSQEHPT